MESTMTFVGSGMIYSIRFDILGGPEPGILVAAIPDRIIVLLGLAAVARPVSVDPAMPETGLPTPKPVLPRAKPLELTLTSDMIILPDSLNGWYAKPRGEALLINVEPGTSINGIVKYAVV